MGDETGRQEKLEDLLLRLVENVNLKNERTEEEAKNLCEIYRETTFRHSYAKISSVLELFVPDQRDALTQHLETIRQYVYDFVKEEGNGYTSEEQKNIVEKMSKLCDHVDLECLRIARIDKVEHIGKRASNELSAADGKLKETEDKAEELGNRIEHYQGQSIAILGIFAGLVVTFSGVIQFTSSSLENLADVTAGNITFFVCLSLLFLFNVVFLLMYCIAKIAGSSIATDCKHRRCENCKTCKCALGRLRKKYPYVFWFNLIGTLLCFALCYIAAN